MEYLKKNNFKKANFFQFFPVKSYDDVTFVIKIFLGKYRIQIVIYKVTYKERFANKFLVDCNNCECNNLKFYFNYCMYFLHAKLKKYKYKNKYKYFI